MGVSSGYFNVVMASLHRVEIFLKAMRSIKVVSESYSGRSLDMFSFSSVPVGVGVCMCVLMRVREGNVPVTTTVRSAIGDVVKTLAYKALEVEAEIPGIKNVGTCVETL